jgi:antitoxin HigA-1
MPPIAHPGRLLKCELAARKLSANRLSLDIGVPSGRITDILNGRRAITADTAVRLGRYFGDNAQFWLDLQGQYEGIIYLLSKTLRTMTKSSLGFSSKKPARSKRTKSIRLRTS